LQSTSRIPAAGCSAESLKAAIGSGHADVFDFDALSNVLAKASVRDNLPMGRRRRIESLLDVLKSQRFFPTPGAAAQYKTYSFAFDSCTAALAAYRERLPKAIALARTISIAELEIDGEYREATHDPLFKDFGDGNLGQEELSHFPDYLIAMTADKLQAAESDALTEMLSAGLPAKVLVQTDDLLGGHADRRRRTFRVRHAREAAREHGDRAQRRLRHAVGKLESVPVPRPHIEGHGVRGTGVLQRVFGRVRGRTAALSECGDGHGVARIPGLLLRPVSGPELGIALLSRRQFPGRGRLAGAGVHLRGREAISACAATPASRSSTSSPAIRAMRSTSLACRAPSGTPAWCRQTSICSWTRRALPTKVPFVSVVDRDNNLHRAVVDDRLMRAALRCREAWHSQQELGGIHNSHAERLLAKKSRAGKLKRRAKQRRARRKPKLQAPAVVPGTTAPAAPAAAAEPEEQKSPDEAYIETPRCTTCNECTQINDKMFSYNEDKQAYIANPDAGSYAQMVEAAESCQVSIIHPGKPRNPNEPGIAELLARAEAFK
jgi:hypothetical protein